MGESRPCDAKGRERAANKEVCIMSQQMVNGSCYDGSRTNTNRMTQRYAVVNPPFKGKHLKPQDRKSMMKRKQRWLMRANGMKIEQINRILGR